MNNEFSPYEQALELKNLGFDFPCLGYYHNTLGSDNAGLFIKETTTEIYEMINLPEDIYTLAPLYQQAFRWFREKGYLMSISRKFFRLDNSIEYNYFICPPDTNEPIEDNILEEYATYEEAELACLKKLIEIIKNK